MGQGPTPFLRANAQLDGPGTPCHRLTARVGRKRAALPRTEATTHQARMPPRCAIAIVHEQGTEVRPGWSSTKCGLPLNAHRPLFALARPPRKARPLASASTLAPRESGPQLLDGFAGQISPKRRAVPTFPQVGEADSGQLPPKTTQKPRTNGEIGARFLRNRSEAEVYTLAE